MKNSSGFASKVSNPAVIEYLEGRQLLSANVLSKTASTAGTSLHGQFIEAAPKAESVATKVSLVTGSSSSLTGTLSATGFRTYFLTGSVKNGKVTFNINKSTSGGRVGSFSGSLRSTGELIGSMTLTVGPTAVTGSLHADISTANLPVSTVKNSGIIATGSVTGVGNATSGTTGTTTTTTTSNGVTATGGTGSGISDTGAGTGSGISDKGAGTGSGISDTGSGTGTGISDGGSGGTGTGSTGTSGEGTGSGSSTGTSPGTGTGSDPKAPMTPPTPTEPTDTNPSPVIGPVNNPTTPPTVPTTPLPRPSGGVGSGGRTIFSETLIG